MDIFGRRTGFLHYTPTLVANHVIYDDVASCDRGRKKKINPFVNAIINNIQNLESPIVEQKASKTQICTKDTKHYVEQAQQL